MRPADAPDLLEQIGLNVRAGLLQLAKHAIDGDVLSKQDESVREEVISALPPEALALAMRELDTHDVVNILEDLDAPQQGLILNALTVVDRAAAQQALSYLEKSTGRLMQREVVAVPEHWTVGDATDDLRHAKNSAGPVLPRPFDQSANAPNRLCHAWPHSFLRSRGAVER